MIPLVTVEAGKLKKFLNIFDCLLEGSGSAANSSHKSIGLNIEIIQLHITFFEIL